MQIEVPFEQWCDEWKNKFSFVENHLSPAIKAAHCDWKCAQYKVVQFSTTDIKEFLVLIDNANSRWIDVSGSSLHVMMQEACNVLWKSN